MRMLLRWLLGRLFRVRVEGDAAVLRRGRALVVANHDSLIDGVMLGLFLPGTPTVMVSRAALASRLVRWLMRSVPHTVVEPSRPLAVKDLIRRIRGGETAVIFPQGRVTTNGGIMKIYDAAGLIALRCDADIVPVRIEGTLHSRFSAMGGNYRKRWLPRVTLKVLPPVKLPELPALPARERRRRLADDMLRLMQRMMFESRPRRTLFEAFVAAAALHGRGTRIIEDQRGRPETYEDMLKASLALGRLAARVSAQGEIVGVLLPNITPTVCLILGLTAMRRTPAMLNYTAGADAMRDACTAAGIRTVITSRRFIEAARLGAAVAALSHLRIAYLEDMRPQFTLGDKLWLACFALWRPLAAVAAQGAQDTAVVLFTSGSEARPKGVAISHEAMLANMAQLQAVIDFGPNDKYLNALPLYHTFGLIACTLMPLVTGTRLMLYTNPLHYRVVPELAYTRDCTYIFGTSTFLGNYGRQAHVYDFYRTRVVIAGGEKLNPEVAELWLRRFGLRIMEGYGATECGPAMALNTPLCYREGTVGRLLPGVEHRIAAVPGISEGGALHVRSPNLMSGYYFHDEPGVLRPPRSEVGEGWHNTGDVVTIDRDGYVSILGRVRRFAKIAGEMVSLELVERIAYQAAPEYKHAATVEQVAGSGESTVLFTTAPELDRIRLQKAAREIGARDLAVARRIVRVPSLPLLGSGKTDYVTLKRSLDAESGAAPSAAADEGAAPSRAARSVNASVG
jgi:acyl-[acyl-carrier-protein]-phospholipid O-acyltransferase/long-chain-fatty-acid--[acyl-carrier-protein] ligase